MIPQFCTTVFAWPYSHKISSILSDAKHVAVNVKILKLVINNNILNSLLYIWSDEHVGMT